MNKLDVFNKDKVKCKKCKEYFDKKTVLIAIALGGVLCDGCYAKWNAACGTDWEWSVLSPKFEIWCNNEQT
jgi:hypothetical protein